MNEMIKIRESIGMLIQQCYGWVIYQLQLSHNTKTYASYRPIKILQSNWEIGCQGIGINIHDHKGA